MIAPQLHCQKKLSIMAEPYMYQASRQLVRSSIAEACIA